MELWTILVAIVVILLGIYLYGTSGYNHFKAIGLPYIKPAPFLGNAWPAFFKRKPFAHVIRATYEIDKTARYVGFFDMMSPVIMLRDPDLIKSVAVKNFDHFPNHRGFADGSIDPLFGKNLFSLRDDRWREVRALLSPAFTSSKMKAMFILMSECAMEFGNYMATLPKNERTMEMKDAFTRYTNDVIATCAFGVKTDSMRDRNNKFYVYGREATTFGGIASLKFFMFRSLPYLCKLFNLKLVRDEIAEFFKSLVADTIKTRDEQGITRPDMLQLMMETRGKLGPGKELTIEDMTAQAFVFFFGGFDSTSTTMCFAAHEIAINPDIQERLQNEIDQVLEECNGEVTYEAINGMKYLEAVINEALRIYPIAVAADRVCTKPLELPPAMPGLKPYMVQKDMYVWLPIYGIHFDPEYFDEPEKFNPDRFLDDNKKIANSGAYLPFGIGPRMCIGNRFALLETKVLLFHILARCDLKPCEKTDIPLELSKKGLSMTAEKGFWLSVEPRSNPHSSIATPVANGAVKS